MKLMGVDVGFAKDRATTGIACLDGHKLHLSRAKTSWENRRARVPEGFRPSVIAIDGPLLPQGADELVRRKCEYLFIKDPFSRRCKPGLTHWGYGLALRRAAIEAGIQFSQLLNDSTSVNRGMVRRDGPVVEAFPNAFLGVFLPEEVFRCAPKLRPGEKFDWLYDRVIQDEKLLSALSESSELPEEVWHRLRVETNHELRAALICLLTAAFAADGTATVVGDVKDGWFWLPPKSLWQNWAKDGLDMAEESYEDELETIEAVNEALAEEGEGRPAAEVHAEIRKKISTTFSAPPKSK
jgi:hypothetical protein